MTKMWLYWRLVRKKSTLAGSHPGFRDTLDSADSAHDHAASGK